MHLSVQCCSLECFWRYWCKANPASFSIHELLLPSSELSHPHTPTSRPTNWFQLRLEVRCEGELFHCLGSKIYTLSPKEKDIYRLWHFPVSQPLKSMSTTGGYWLHFGVDALSCSVLAHVPRNAWLLSSEHLWLQFKIGDLKILGHCKCAENKM